MTDLTGSVLRQRIRSVLPAGPLALAAWDHVRASRFVFDSLYNAVRSQGVAKINPYDVLWVDPQEINYCTVYERRDTNRRFDMWSNAGAVRGGDWDRKVVEFEDLNAYRSLKEHFLEGVPWNETERYRFLARRIKNGETKHGAGTIEELNYRFEQLDNLFEAIKTHGYKSQKSLLCSDSDTVESVNKYLTTFEKMFDEITVNISRDGTLLFNDSRHRLAIAKLTDTKLIPVRIVVRHETWQRRRNAVADANQIDKTHPDLQTLSIGPVQGLVRELTYLSRIMESA